MKIIVKTAEGQFQEIDYVVGTGIVGVSIQRVSFNWKDVGDHQRFIDDLRNTILPRMPQPVEEDFLP